MSSASSDSGTSGATVGMLLELCLRHLGGSEPVPEPVYSITVTEFLEDDD